MNFKKLLFFLGAVFATFSLFSQPLNDFQCTPHNIGFLPPAPPCSASGGVQTGLQQVVTGSTIGATNDGLSGTIASCYPTSSPPLKDVWYKFTASETHIQIEIAGVGGSPLNNVYVALYESLEDECVGLMPRECFSATGTGPHNFEFGPLAYGARYFLQVASTTPTTGNGNFVLKLNSKSVCSDCMKNSFLQAYPLPVKAAYPPDTTVGFCYTVFGYNELFGNRLHGVVPLFGSGWDVTTLNIISTADSADGMGVWKWFNNISIPGDPNISGFFYDVGGDNNPTNNLGDHAVLPHLWTFCFSIKTHKQALCSAGQNDLSIRFLNFSDGESGSLITPLNCAGDAEYVFDAHIECCSKPMFAIPQSTPCDNQPGGSITAFGGDPFSFTGYKYELYNDAGAKIDSVQIVGLTPYSNNTLTAGNYYLNVTNNQAGCKSAVNFRIFGPLVYSLQQVGFGCGSSCTNSAILIIDAGATQSILWDNGSTSTLAINLCPGWHTITMVDTGSIACTITDSIFITALPFASSFFDYSQSGYCTSDLTADITDFPAASGGSFSIIGPSLGTSINPSTGSINISSATANGQIVVKYQAPPPCSGTSFDTIQIELSPPVVSIYSLIHTICLGDSISYYNSSPNTIKWFDMSDNLIGIQNPGDYFNPFGGIPTVPNLYSFYVRQVDFNISSCLSDSVHLLVNVAPIPSVNAGQDVNICANYTATLTGTGAFYYSWQPSAYLDNPTNSTTNAVVNQTTTFYLIGTSVDGCTGRDTVTVFVDSTLICDLVIYNGITPNGDGHNDFWYIDGISNFANNVVAVFNRWGDKVWEGVGYNNTSVRWEGQAFNGRTVIDGTYYYVISLNDKIYKGWVEVTR